MHTVVIQLQNQPQDWHLVEPFFYKVQSSGQLSYFLCKRNRDGYLYEELYQQISHHLAQQRIVKWQAVVMMNTPTATFDDERLRVKMVDLKKRLFQRLAEHEMHTDDIAIILLDSLKRKEEVPEEVEAHPFWQLDNRGYYFDESFVRSPSNMFLAKELAELDLMWGNPVSLKDAGRIDQPNATFLALLDEKKDRVAYELQRLIQGKKVYAANRENGTHDHENGEYLSNDDLTDIEAQFRKRLELMMQAPLPSNLETFQPTSIMKDILQVKLSIFETIQDYRIIRQASSMYSVERRTKALVSLTFFIQAIATQPDCLEKIPRGTIHELETSLKSDKLAKLLSSYDSCLHAAKTKIENKILDREALSKQRFEEVTVQPYTTEPLPESAVSRPPSFQSEQARTYFQAWQSFITQIEEELENRQEQMITEAKRGARKIAILKRRAPVAKGEDVEIHDYIEELKGRVDTLYAQLDELEPGANEEIEAWQEHTEKASFQLNLSLQSSPDKGKYLLVFLFAGLFLLGPHLYLLDWNLERFSSHWLDYTFIPLLTIAFILLVSYFVKRQLTKPVEGIIRESVGLKKELHDRQQISHTKYNRYLNKLYELFRTRQHYFLMKEAYETMKQENYLLRYHLRKVQQYLESCELLIRNLGLERQLEKESFYEFFETKFRPTRDVQENTIYFPFATMDHTFEDHKFDVHVGQTKSSYTSDSAVAVERFKFVKDKVYT